jgi:hypothetical protein
LALKEEEEKEENLQQTLKMSPAIKKEEGKIDENSELRATEGGGSNDDD